MRSYAGGLAERTQEVACRWSWLQIPRRGSAQFSLAVAASTSGVESALLMNILCQKQLECTWSILLVSSRVETRARRGTYLWFSGCKFVAFVFCVVCDVCEPWLSVDVRMTWMGVIVLLFRLCNGDFIV